MKLICALLVLIIGVLSTAACSSGEGRDPTAAPTAVSTPGSQPDEPEAQMRAAMEAYIDAFNEEDLERAHRYYSSCAREAFTLDNLEFGRAATGTLFLLRFDVLMLEGDVGRAYMETTSERLVGTQNLFKIETDFVRENGEWKIDSPRQPDCP